MTAIRKSACRWFRNLKVHPLGGGMESIVVFYNPSRVCVEYETGATPHPQIRRVVIYAKSMTAGKMKIESVVTDVPLQMQRELFDIVHDNERNYGSWIAAVLLPDGLLVTKN